MLGIAGPVGSGKSTLLTLLLRQHDMDNGTIQFGDIKIKTHSYQNGETALPWSIKARSCSLNLSSTTSL